MISSSPSVLDYNIIAFKLNKDLQLFANHSEIKPYYAEHLFRSAQQFEQTLIMNITDTYGAMQLTCRPRNMS